MIPKRGRMHRQLIIFGSAFGTTADLAQGLWRSKSGRRWMIPLAIFLCLTGLILTLAASVEALAPFVYSIF
jgi:anti-sigma-K factor RskA